MPAEEALPWDRLMEASDKIGPAAVKLVAYKNTVGGYAICVAHIASFREAGVSYSVRPTGIKDHPFGMFVLPDNISRAHEIIERVGLGSDIKAFSPGL
jgi:hypothetical protein